MLSNDPHSAKYSVSLRVALHVSELSDSGVIKSLFPFMFHKILNVVRFLKNEVFLIITFSHIKFEEF